MIFILNSVFTIVFYGMRCIKLYHTCSGGGTLMTPVRGDQNSEGRAMGCGRFQSERGGGGKAAPRCQRRTTQRRVVWWLGRPKAATGVWRSKMNKENWVSGPNVRLCRTVNCVGEKIWMMV
jgi:hypothetical protein